MRVGFSPKRRLEWVVVYDFRGLEVTDRVVEFFRLLGADVSVRDEFGFEGSADAVVYVSSPGIAVRALRLRKKGEDPVVLLVTPEAEVICLSGHHWGGEEVARALAGWLGGSVGGSTVAEAEGRPPVEDVLDVLGIDPREYRERMVELVRALERGGVWVEDPPHPGVLRYLEELGVKAGSREEAGLVVSVSEGRVRVRGCERGEGVRGGDRSGRSGADDGEGEESTEER
jgi:hypothetical protein